MKKRLSLLYTTGRQTTPTCSSCTAVSCQCVRAWKREIENQTVKDRKEANNDEDNNDKESNDEENNLEEERKKAHYSEREQNYGKNRSPIVFPLYNCPNQKAVIDNKINGDFKLPDELIPEYDPEKVCDKHGFKFVEDDMAAKCATQQVIVYHERGETIYNCRVFYRVTVGGCKCKHEYDGHAYLLYHMGGGKMWDYLTLQNYLLSMVNGGTTAYAYHKTISDNCKAMGTTFNCRYNVFLDACDGFVANLRFDEKACFSCSNCGTEPKYFVGDAKANMAPLQKRLKELGIKELLSQPDDENILIHMDLR